MHNWDVFVFHVVYHDLPDTGFCLDVSVPEEEEITALEGRFHAPGENDDDRGWRVGYDRESFPHLAKEEISKQPGCAWPNSCGMYTAAQDQTHNEGRREDEAEVHQLRSSLPRVSNT